MTVIAEIAAGQLADLIKQAPAGDEVVLTEGDGASLAIRSLQGRRVLTPVISQAGLAEEMFGRQ